MDCEHAKWETEGKYPNAIQILNSHKPINCEKRKQCLIENNETKNMQILVNFFREGIEMDKLF